ncbi:G-protein coupled receptor moody-like [Actinia tenebrosa]|uniref:G-protein coupled receptor moody-like n=1 Tax=Actinia tenebrosa TaxID=6105 RepID=A0A6P8IVG2_ACTTE|nr:G-protein coupled receptor moody-like [Actinia tenebrosa]
MNNTNSSVVNLFTYSLVLAPRPIFEVIFESLSIIIIIILALFGNILILIVVYKEGGFKKSSNILLINLAMTDVTSAVLGFPLVLVTIATGRWIMGDVMCQFQAYMSYVLYSCTLCTLTVVSVNRYTLLSKPHFHRKIFGRRKTVALVIGIWVTSFSFATPPLIGWSRYVFLADYAICVTDPIASPSFNTFLFLFLLVNMFIIIFCYAKIFSTLKRIKKLGAQNPDAVANQSARQPVANQGPGAPANQDIGAPVANQEPEHNEENVNGESNPSQANQNLASRSNEIQITAIIFIIICLFGFCYLPTFIVGFFVFSSSSITRSMRLFSTFSISLTSVVNPFVFCIKSKAFRKLAKQIYRGITGCFQNE